MSLMILALALFLLQDPVQTVFRTEKGDYVPAVNKCKEAEGLLEGDPSGAVERLDEVLANPKIRKVECRIRIEERPAEYTQPYAFYPYQYRGRARLALGRKAEPEAAERLLSGAVDDLKKSLDLGVRSSETYLATAREELRKAKAATAKAVEPAREDPLAKFTPVWQDLLNAFRFKTARARLESDGKALAEAQRKTLADQADAECRKYLTRQMIAFRQNLMEIKSDEDLTAMTEQDFNVSFSLPPADELTVTVPSYDWAVAALPGLKAVRAGKAPGASLLSAAAAAVPLEEQGDDRWFKVCEGVAYQSLRASLQTEVDAARDAPRSARDARRAAADALLAPWKAFYDKLDARFREREKTVVTHDRDLARTLQGFPVDLPELEKIDLEACFGGASPEAELSKAEEQLKALESRPAVSLESRQKLYSFRVIAAAVRGLLEGKQEDEVARELAALGAKLREVGGPVDAARFGPRVAAVLEKLR